MPYTPRRNIDNESLGAEIYKLATGRVSTVVAAIATADANTQTGAYVQADVQSIRTLANANKAKINEVIAALKTAGLMASS